MVDFVKRVQLQKLMALGALILLYVFFSIFGRGFNSMPMTLAILSRSYFVGFLAIGVTFVIITGGIDLSIGTVMMCSAVIGGFLFRNGVPLWLCLLIMILIGTTFGVVNALLVTKLKLPPFIATLGMMMVSAGLGSIVTNVQAQTFPSPMGGGENAWFARVFIRDGDLPTGVFFLAGYLIITLIILKKTKLGRYTYAIGSNEEAVRLSGVNASNWKMLPYIISGFSAGLASIFFAAAYFVITPGIGQGFELDAIAATVIGGTSLAGGVGSVTGTIIGVFIMSVLAVGLVSMNLPTPYQVFLAGVVVIGAVFMDIQRTNKANQVKKEK